MDLAEALSKEESRVGRRPRARGLASGRVLLAPAPFEDERVQGAIDFIFGRRVLKSDIELAFSAFVDGHFYRAKIGYPYKGVEGAIEHGNHVVTIGGSILRDNERVGKFRRTFTREKKTGHVVARHDLLELDDNLPLGIGSKMLRNTLRFEVSQQVKKVYLSAAWVGRYVWASLGWSWADADERSEKIKELRAFLRKVLMTGETCFSTARLPKACASYATLEEGAAGISKALAIAPAFEFAALRLYTAAGNEILHDCTDSTRKEPSRRIVDCHAGKTFLLSPRTAEWEGVLLLQPGNAGFEHCKKKLQLSV
jgi:hypothetical protein